MNLWFLVTMDFIRPLYSQKNNDNDDVNALFQNDDIKTFVQKVEATHNKWSTYTRNNFKMKSNMDVQELFKFLEKVENRRN